jgi:5-(carboxyamino)imidazole ribonucleotide synthase
MNANTVLGILGSGQLARMTLLAASELGIKTHILCTESTDTKSPAEQVATYTTKSSFTDLDQISEFAKLCDFITLENEFIDQNVLEFIETQFPHKLYPTAQTFKLITEKKSFANAGIPVCSYQEVSTKEDILSFINQHGLPVVLKSAKGGYDGYGNATIKTEDDIEPALQNLKGQKLIEAFIPYVKEVAIMVARNDHGMVVYPIAETIQENHICHYVLSPANIPSDVEEKIRNYAQIAMTAINARGIFAFEFFLTAKNEIYLNESAPRPHNSGHYTMNACSTSQFHNHVRSVLNLPLGDTTMTTKHCVMLNLLGTKNQIAELQPINVFMNVPNSHLHLYGKQNSKIGRKMGHFTICGDNQDEMMAQAKKLKESYSL